MDKQARQIQERQKYDYTAVIIGGGISGIAAARAFLSSSSQSSQNNSQKLTWCILQSSNRLGGRLQSIILDGKRIDAGAYQLASFMQKRDKQNSLYQLIKKGFCQINFRQKFNKVYYYNENGYQYKQQDLQKIQQVFQKLSGYAKQWLKQKDNLSVKECCDRFVQLGQLDQLNDLQKELFWLVILMEEHQQAADGEDLATHSFFGDGMEEDELDGYPLPTITYHGLMQKLAQDIPQQNIKLNSQVINIHRFQTYCQIAYIDKQAKQTKIIKTKYIICAAPLSTIVSKRIKFIPELPQSHQFVFNNLGFGVMQKIILAFQQPFWPLDAQRIKITSKQYGKFPHFSNLSGSKQNSTEQSYILCCYITAKYAKQLYKKSNDTQIIQEILQHLKNAFPDKKQQIKLKQSYITKWMQKDNIFGSFSYMKPQLRFNQAKQISNIIDNQLIFVGEYCYHENIGCAHGAYQTGWQAGLNILSLQNHIKKQ